MRLPCAHPDHRRVPPAVENRAGVENLHFGIPFLSRQPEGSTQVSRACTLGRDPPPLPQRRPSRSSPPTRAAGVAWAIHGHLQQLGPSLGQLAVGSCYHFKVGRPVLLGRQKPPACHPCRLRLPSVSPGRSAATRDQPRPISAELEVCAPSPPKISRAALLGL